jgi:superfamily I DNA/RNA helicase
MKLAIYDAFFDSFIKLPKNIQKKTHEFMEKFRNTSEASSINYEKITNFRDSQLRTVRIDLAYRAIIHAPSEGDLYHILWVDNHDSAMDWAKNKVFEWNRLTQSFQIYQPSEELIKEEIQPLKKETPTFLSKYNDELLKLGVPAVLLDSIKKIDNLNDLQKFEDYLPKEAFENLYYLFDGVPISVLIEEMEEGKVPSEEFSDQIQSINNKRFFFEIKDDTELASILKDDFKKWKVFLHPSQRKLVESNYKGAVKISGGAGTGKTVAAIHRAKWLSDNKRPKESKPIFFTTFTKALTKNLTKDFNEIGINKSIVKLDNIHHFVVNQVKELKIIPEDAKIIEFGNRSLRGELWEEVIDFKLSRFTPEFLSSEYIDVIIYHNIKNSEEYLRVPRVGREQKLGRKDRLEIWSLIEEYNKKKLSRAIYELDELFNKLTDYYEGTDKPFSHIICDELQDLSNVELRLLRNMVEEGENDLFLLGDPFQNIYSRKISFPSLGINIRGKRSKNLRLNYRTTEEIRKGAISFINDEQFDNFDGESEDLKGYISLMHGDLPEYKVFNSAREETQFLIEKIGDLTDKARTNIPIPFNQICIASRRKTDIAEIKKSIHHIFPYLDIASDSQTGNLNGIILSTFHSLKGLEFKIVFLVGVNNQTVPIIPSDFTVWSKVEQLQHIKSEKALLYVAMSRAIQAVFISGYGNKSEIIKF